MCPEDFVVGEMKENNTGKKGTAKEVGFAGWWITKKNNNLEYTFWDWAIHPEGIVMCVDWINERYDLPALISENGLGDFDNIEIDANGDKIIKDQNRIKYYKIILLLLQQWKEVQSV